MFLLLLKWKSEDNMKDYSILGIDLRQQPRVNFLTLLHTLKCALLKPILLLLLLISLIYFI